MTARDDELRAFATALGLAFSDLALFGRALTHDSYLNEHPGEPLEDNERLEFLGDAVIDFLAAEWLYARLPDEPEGRLTQIRAALVRNDALGRIAASLGVGPMLLMGRGEAEHGGRKRARNLGGALEAILGALYLDSGLDAARAFIVPHFEDLLAAILRDESAKDAKSLLNEWSQRATGREPAYHAVETSGPEHDPAFVVEVRIAGEVYGKGRGRSKREASQAAAQAALASLRKRGLSE
ncbi:MAG: ribonuclease III [Anaerolineae bacterium]|nr:ribonuclease III [Anaerolineae bacterium]